MPMYKGKKGEGVSTTILVGSGVNNDMPCSFWQVLRGGRMLKAKTERNSINFFMAFSSFSYG